MKLKSKLVLLLVLMVVKVSSSNLGNVGMIEFLPDGYLLLEGNAQIICC